MKPAILSSLLLCFLLGGSSAAQTRDWTIPEPEPAADLATTGRSTYFILEPGYAIELAGPEGKRAVSVTILVTDETVTVDGVETRVVEERESVDGKLVEVSRNFVAISRKTGNVYYFGEEVDDYGNKGEVVGHEGGWRAGVDGAKRGMLMPGAPAVGARYYQEHSPGRAMDRAEVVSVTATEKTPAGSFTRCVQVEETNPLESGERDTKVHAPGIGIIRDGSLRLVRYGVKKQNP